MATKIRLQRHGKKRAAFYHIVVANEKAKRDGQFIEKIGTYNPNTDPAIIDLKFDRALHWIKIGAQPTDTARAILSYKGVMLKNHLDKGVAKGALTEAETEKKFEAWVKEKETKIVGKAESIEKGKASAAADRMKKETEQKEAKAAAIAAKEVLIEEVPAGEIVPEVARDGEEAPATEVKEETPTVEAKEAPATEVKEETPTVEAKEAPATEVKEETPTVEAKEAPATEVKEETPTVEAKEASATKVKEETSAVEEAKDKEVKEEE